MKLLIVFIVCFVNLSAWATPVIDTAGALKQYLILVKQLRELKKQVQQGNEMINEGKKVIQDSEGHYGFGHLLDSDSDFKNREWAPSNWEDALKNLSGGNSERYQELLKSYQKEHFSLSDKQFSEGASHSVLDSYKRLVHENAAAGTNANGEYQDIEKLLKEVRQLMKKIESAPNTKAAMDLNSRLVAELSFISIEELRMQTLMNHQMAASTYDEIQARSREALFNRLPKEKSK